MKGESADRPELASRGLLILTGASHTGKTSVAKAILDLKGPPAALLSVDQTLEHTLVRPPGDRWSEIPLAYRLLRLQAEALLEADWFVVLESTFTYVPGTGPPEFHAEEVERFADLALAAGAPLSLVQLSASEATVFKRAEATRRLPLDVVAATHALHDLAAMPHQVIQVETDASGPEDLARRVLALIAA